MRKVAYLLDLPLLLSGVHNVFHISMICKYEPVQGHVLKLPEFQLDNTTSYEEQPIQILEVNEHVL